MYCQNWHGVADRMESVVLASLTSFLETLPEPHILCDRSYKIVGANAAYRARWPPGARVIGKT